MVWSPVFRGTPKEPLWIDRGGLVVPAWAENPCDTKCCGSTPGEGCDCFADCCVGGGCDEDPPPPELTATFTMSGIVDGEEAAYPCACSNHLGYSYFEEIMWSAMNGSYILGCRSPGVTGVSCDTIGLGTQVHFGWRASYSDCNTVGNAVLVQRSTSIGCSDSGESGNQSVLEYHLVAISACVACDTSVIPFVMKLTAFYLEFYQRTRQYDATTGLWTPWHSCGATPPFYFLICETGESSAVGACSDGEMTMPVEWPVPTVTGQPGCTQQGQTCYPGAAGFVSIALNV